MAEYINPIENRHECYRNGEFAMIDTKLKIIAEDIADIKKALSGNGRPGLIERISNLEVGMKITYIIVGFSISIFGLLVYLR